MVANDCCCIWLSVIREEVRHPVVTPHRIIAITTVTVRAALLGAAQDIPASAGSGGRSAVFTISQACLSVEEHHFLLPTILKFGS